MTETGRERKLAVLLHADVVGSTGLVHRNEATAHARIRDAFNRFSVGIQAYGGIVHEVRGDALVAELRRASDAVVAAIAFQVANARHNQHYEDGIAPEIRVGISLGEVVVADNTITGPGIVLAQRVEQLAACGGVCVTGAVHEAIPGRLPLAYEDLGEQSLKGFDDPVRVYAVELKSGARVPPPDPAMANESKRGPAWVAWPAALLLAALVTGVAWMKPWEAGLDPARPEIRAFPSPNAPSIAVLPFTNRSGDPDQNYFAEGIADDLTTDLSKLSGLFVVARDSAIRFADRTPSEIGHALGVRYILKGSIRRAAEAIRINVELIEVKTSGNLWAERYDGKVGNVFDLQDSVTRQIVKALKVELSDSESRHIIQRSTTDPIAYDYLLRGNALLVQFTPTANAAAREMFERALARDRTYARAFGGLAFTYAYDARFRWTDDPAAALESAHSSAREAVRLAPHLARAHLALGAVLVYMRQSDEAVAAARTAIRLNPAYADSYALLSFALVHSGHPGEALAAMDATTRLNPQPPALYHLHRGRSLYFLGRYDEALASLEAAIAGNPGFLVSHLYLSATHARLGNQDDAEWAAEEVLNLAPAFSVETWLRNEIFTDRKSIDRLTKALLKAGLPT